MLGQGGGGAGALPGDGPGPVATGAPDSDVAPTCSEEGRGAGSADGDAAGVTGGDPPPAIRRRRSRADDRIHRGRVVSPDNVRSPVHPFEDHCWQDVMGADVLEVYAPYRRTVGIRGRAALLAIDLFACVFPSERKPVLEAVREDPRSCGEYAWDAVPHIQRLLSVARSRHWPVIFTTAAVADGGRGGEERATFRAHERRSTAQLTADYSIDSRFPVLPGDVVVRKERASAFDVPVLESTLRSSEIDTVVICGESTSGCVRASAVDAYSRGFHTVIVEECVFDRNLLSHKVNLFDLHHKYADVLHLDEVHAPPPWPSPT